MDWIAILIFFVIVYAVVAYTIHSKKLFPEHVTFYGPILALRSRKVAFLDGFIPYSRILRAYGTVGAVMVIAVSVLMVVMLFFTLQDILIHQPPSTEINKLQNLFAIPGVNEFIPFTIPVWIAFVVTLVVHEFGHGILSRVESIRVKFIGLLFFVIPIGAFVEPDEEEFEKAPKVSKIRMLGAGITNNMVVGLISFILFIGLLGMAVPNDAPLIKAVYVGFPAANASVQPNTVITGIDGTSVATIGEVSTILNRTKPGDTLILELETNGKRSTYPLKLSTWPESLGDRSSGFMGVEYYNAAAVKNVFASFASPIGLVYAFAVPIWVIRDPAYFGFLIILLNETADMIAWSTPFPYYWFFVQVLFWCAWFNILVALCNALPMVPLDGGYILREGTENLLQRFGMQNYAGNIVTMVSVTILVVIALVFSLPTLFELVKSLIAP